jgi:hypothetical protein
MIVYPFLLSCALAQDSPSPGSPAQAALDAQLKAGEHAHFARMELEVLEEVLTQDGVSEEDLHVIRARLEAAKLECAKADQALDDAEGALNVQPARVRQH